MLNSVSYQTDLGSSLGQDEDAKKSVKRKKSPIRNMPDSKLAILQKYSVVFKEIKIDKIKSAPILIPKHILLNKIEQCYDKQFELLMKVKSKQVLNLPNIVYKVTKAQSNNNLNFFIQSLSNLVYSADKYADSPEIMWFLKFIDAPPQNLQYLFWLYIRQHFKIITYTNFIASNKGSKGHDKLLMKYQTAENILAQAFYSDGLAHGKLLKHIQSKFTKKEKVNYYKFLVECCSVNLNYRDIAMMEQLIALYTIKQREELADSQMEMDQVQFGDNDDWEKSGMMGEQQGSYNNQRSQLEEIEANAEQGGGNGGQQAVTVNLADLDVHEQLILKNSIRRDKKDKALQGLIKNELRNYVNKLITNFIKKNDIALENIGRSMQIASKQLYNKLFYLCTVLFVNEREKFFKLLRKDIQSDEDTLDFWNQLNDHYDSLKSLNVDNPSIAKDFLTRIFENETVSREILFYLNFHFKNDYDIVNYHVDFELKEEE